MAQICMNVANDITSSNTLWSCQIRPQHAEIPVGSGWLQHPQMKITAAFITFTSFSKWSKSFLLDKPTPLKFSNFPVRFDYLYHNSFYIVAKNSPQLSSTSSSSASESAKTRPRQPKSRSLVPCRPDAKSIIKRNLQQIIRNLQVSLLYRETPPHLPSMYAQAWESSEVARSALVSSSPTKRMDIPHLPCSHRISIFTGLIKPRAL